MGYADDSQLYVRLPARQLDVAMETVASMNVCLMKVREWMLLNKLKINDSKTECMLIASKSTMAKLSSLNITITVGSDTIIPKKSVSNLGSTLDSELAMNGQISQVIRSAYYHLRRISKIKCHLDQDTCARLIHSCVTSRLDYHNALLTTVPDCKLHKLQLVQNNAARLLSGVRRDVHITPVLQKLHWLPIKHRISYKVLSFIHNNIYNDYAPQYLKDLFEFYRPSRNLRAAADSLTLTVRKTKKRVGTCSFPVVGARLWNALPSDIRTMASKIRFKTHLKTYLFRLAYSL
jgi:hypothetical protein